MTIPNGSEDAEQMKFSNIANSTATMETVRQFLIKLSVPLPYNPAVPLLGVYQSEI